MQTRRLQLDPSLGAAVGGLLAIAVAAALTGVRSEVPQVSVVLIMVLIVIVGAMIGGRLGGAVTAVIAALSFDFFHTLPYNSFTIEKREDVQAAILLLIVGLVIGGFARRTDLSEQKAEAGRSEVRRLHRVAELIADGAPAPAVVEAARAELTELLRLDRCEYEDSTTPTQMPTLQRSGVLPARTHHFVDDGLQLPLGGVAVEVRGGGRAIGRFMLFARDRTGASLEDRIAAVTIADQVGAALALSRSG